MAPEKIGKYNVIELLGRGGMGEVYLGEDPYIGRRVAIKIIKGADPGARDRFLHEARVIGGLSHPAIVSLLDFDFSGDEPFLVMELLKGQGLDAWLHDPHSLAEQLVVLDDLCQALAYAHENGVLHRDVKPSNVQILPNGHAKLMDFGIARAAAGKLTATGSVMGTPEYMAPEILNDAAYSASSDLYAASVLLYEMFTGRNPFAASTIGASLTNVLTLEPPDLRAVRPDFPPRLAETLMACLRKKPDQRPHGFFALMAAGREAVGGAPAEIVPETRAIPKVPSVPRPAVAAAGPLPSPSGARKAPWALFGGAGFVLALGVVWQVSRGPVPAELFTKTPSPAPIIARGEPSPSEAPHASQSPTRSDAVAIPKGTPGPDREAGRPRPSPARTEAMPPATPTPTPPVAAFQATAIATPASTSSATPAATPTPLPPPSSPAAITAIPAPVAPSRPQISLSSVTPRTLRRGSSVDLEVQGEGFRNDLKAVVMQGRRRAEGIKVVKVDFVSSRIIRVRILIEAETPLLTYSLVVQDGSGALTQGLQIEVVL